MKMTITLIALLASLTAFSHDEGHGPKLVDSGKYGGVLASVIKEADISKGTKSERVYKAELVKSEDNEISVYIYDEKMNLIPMAKFHAEAKATLEIEKNHKFITEDFKLTAKANHFVGMSPKPQKRPFNIDVRIKEGNRTLFVAFDNLD